MISRYDGATIDLGNRELSRLWNIEKDNLEACKSESRKCIPMLKSFLDDALDEMDPEQQVDEQYQSVNDEKYQWMGGRFLIFNSDQFINIAIQQCKGGKAGQSGQQPTEWNDFAKGNPNDRREYAGIET